MTILEFCWRLASGLFQILLVGFFVGSVIVFVVCAVSACAKREGR